LLLIFCLSSNIINNEDVTQQLSGDKILITAKKHNLTQIEIEQIKATLNNDEWYEQQKMLSTMGTLIVQAVATALTQGVLSGYINMAAKGVAGVIGGTTASQAVINSAVTASLSSISTQVTTKVLDSAITGNPLDLKLDDLLRDAFKAGLSAGINTQITDSLSATSFNTDTLQGKFLQDFTQAGTSSLIYGGDFGTNLLRNVSNTAAAESFKYIGHSLYENEKYKDLKLPLTTVTHAMVGGVVSKIQGGDFNAGAIATATGHVVGEYMKSTAKDSIANGESYEDYIDISYFLIVKSFWCLFYTINFIFYFKPTRSLNKPCVLE
jgi:hypothetical protein